jgi:hypothetical protein
MPYLNPNDSASIKPDENLLYSLTEWEGFRLISKQSIDPEIEISFEQWACELVNTIRSTKLDYRGEDSIR